MQWANYSVVLISLLASFTHAASLNKIRITGNHRITNNSIIATIGTKIGSEFDQKSTKASIKALQKTNQFTSVTADFNEDTGTLSVKVKESPTVKTITIKGNSRLATHIVKSLSGMKPGDAMDAKKSDEILKVMYKSGNFSDITVDYKKASGELIITVVERPTIKSIKVEGNSLIPKDGMNETLEKLGLEHGKVFNPIKLKELTYGLAAQYKLRGYQDTVIEEKIEKVSNNQVVIELKVTKEYQYQVRYVTIEGVHAFSKSKILEVIQLNTPSIYAAIFGGNYYSEIAMDLAKQKLKEWYEDNGYLQASVMYIKPIAIDKGRHFVDIKIAVAEGPRYELTGIEIKADKKVQALEFDKIVKLNQQIAKNQTVPFSRKKVRELMSHIQSVLEKNGYGVQSIQPKLDVDEKLHKVKLSLEVEKGKPTLVRRIIFKGNTKTLDRVLRREMLVSEGEVLTRFELDESKRRIANLGYLKNVHYELVPVDKQSIDIVVFVEEDHMAKFILELSTTDKERVVGTLALEHSNVFGTGNSLEIKASKAYKGATVLSLGGYVPFITNTGLGMGYKLSYERQKPNRSATETDTVSDYDKAETYSGILMFNFPLAMHADMDLNISARKHVMSKVSSSQMANNTNFINNLFIDWGGKEQNEYYVQSVLKHKTLDRYYAPRSGHYLEVSGTLGRFGTLPYWIVESRMSWYLHSEMLDVVLNPRMQVRAGGSTSDSFKNYYQAQTGSLDYFSSLPPLKKFYGGGISPVRGILNFGDKQPIQKTTDNNTVTYYDATGGDLLTTASLNLVLPQFVHEMVQTSLFLDGGYIYSQKNTWDFKKWVYSTGLQLEIRTPLAPITLIGALPVKTETAAPENDIFKKFQFSIMATVY